MAHALMDRIESAYDKSPLPELPDSQKIEAVLVQMREELYTQALNSF